MKIVILAGGEGVRLFPLSRTEYPKQFLKLFDDESLLVQTIKRFDGIAQKEDIIVVTGKKYEFNVKTELKLCGMEKVRVIVEPEARNTAPAIALAVNYCKNVLQCDDDEIIFVAASDHIIDPVGKFCQATIQGMELAAKGKIVVFGITPTRPDTGYGYIEAGEQLGSGYLVKFFKEKPDEQLAAEYIKNKDFYWNSGMFVFSIKVLLSELERHNQPLYAITAVPYDDMLDGFSRMPKISIDNAVMEFSSSTAMVELDCSWNDIGSWDALYEMLEKDEGGNVIKGDVLAIDCENSLLIGQKRLVTALGLSDILMVETDDVILVTRRGESQRVKEIVRYLEDKKRNEAISTNTVYKPWGYFTVHEKGDNYKIKTIVVNPGASLSLQLHKHRSEHWVVTKGQACAVINNVKYNKRSGQSLYIPVGVQHRLSNPYSEPLEIIEVQNGHYLGEDDVLRFDDMYGRDQ